MSTITTTIKQIRLFTQNHIRGTLLGDGVISFFKALGVNDFFTRILYAQDRKNPTKSMQYATKYYSEHQKELEATASLFADNISKEVYFSNDVVVLSLSVKNGILPLTVTYARPL